MFESPAWVTEMAHLVFATKSKDLSWTPGTRRKREPSSSTSCLLTSIAMATLPYTK